MNSHFQKSSKMWKCYVRVRVVRNNFIFRRDWLFPHSKMYLFAFQKSSDKRSERNGVLINPKTFEMILKLNKNTLFMPSFRIRAHRRLNASRSPSFSLSNLPPSLVSSTQRKNSRTSVVSGKSPPIVTCPTPNAVFGRLSPFSMCLFHRFLCFLVRRLFSLLHRSPFWFASNWSRCERAT